MANIKLKKPQIGSHAWGDSINENFAKIENNLNGVSTEMSALQHDLYSMRQLTISGAIKISETIFNENDGNQGYVTLKLKVYNFKDNGMVETTGVETDIINIPTNTCYKVIEKYDELSGTNKLDPQSIRWAQGDFLVVGELINTTKSFSRLPISIGMYMKPSLGTDKNEGKLVWTPTMAETNPNILAMSLPIQYAYGTVKTFPINRDSNNPSAPITINLEPIEPISSESPVNGMNGFSRFPILQFYQKVNGILQKVEVDYKLDRVIDLIEIEDELSTLYFNTEKTNDEIIAMCENFDWDLPQLSTDPSNKIIKLLNTEELQSIYIKKVLNSDNPYSIVYTNNDQEEEFWSQASGTIKNSTSAFDGQIVTLLYRPDEWKDFIYKKFNWQVTLNFDNNNDDYVEDIYMYVTMITSSSPEVNTTEQ